MTKDKPAKKSKKIKSATELPDTPDNNPKDWIRSDDLAESGHRRYRGAWFHKSLVDEAVRQEGVNVFDIVETVDDAVWLANSIHEDQGGILVDVVNEGSHGEYQISGSPQTGFLIRRPKSYLEETYFDENGFYTGCDEETWLQHKSVIDRDNRLYPLHPYLGVRPTLGLPESLLSQEDIKTLDDSGELSCMTHLGRVRVTRDQTGVNYITMDTPNPYDPTSNVFDACMVVSPVFRRFDEFTFSRWLIRKIDKFAFKKGHDRAAISLMVLDKVLRELYSEGGHGYKQGCIVRTIAGTVDVYGRGENNDRQINLEIHSPS